MTLAWPNAVPTRAASEADLHKLAVLEAAHAINPVGSILRNLIELRGADEPMADF